MNSKIIYTILSTILQTLSYSNAFDVEPYPMLRYTEYSKLTEYQQDIAKELGYTEDTWNLPGTLDIEYYSWWYFTSLDDDSIAYDTKPLEELGFTEDTWDCWHTHYNEYTWEDLETYDIASSAEALGWNQEMWDTYDYYDEASVKPDTELKFFNELTDEEKTAALVMCYTQKLWDYEALSSFCLDKPVGFRVGGGDSKPERSCDWISQDVSRCSAPSKGQEFTAHCPNVCGQCDSHDCAESKYKFYLKTNEEGKRLFKKCKFVEKNLKKCNNFSTRLVCPSTCKREGCE